MAYQFQRYDASISGYWVVQVKEMYSYTPDGRLVKKRLQLQDGTAVLNLDASLSYDMWGRLQAITYPNGASIF